MLYIIVAILIFGLLIAVHEFGHFFTAKLFGVKVNEFSIGMGPALWKRERGETLYSLRLLPVGGYCAMEGEDEDTGDPRAFGNAAAWKKVIILTAGAAMNFLVGFLLILGLYSQNQAFYRPMIAGFLEEPDVSGCGLQPGDVVYSLNGHRVYFYDNLSLLLSRAGDTVDWVVERNGERVKVSGTDLPLRPVENEEGQTVYLRGLTIQAKADPATPGNILKYSWYGALDFVRMVWMSLGDLVTGAVGLREMSGPVGIVTMMSDVGASAPTTRAAAFNILYLSALIAVNLAVMNLLPLPALDGGRIFFLAVNGILYTVFRRKIDAKYEGYVHMAGLALLMGLSLAVTFSDVGKLLGR